MDKLTYSAIATQNFNLLVQFSENNDFQTIDSFVLQAIRRSNNAKLSFIDIGDAPGKVHDDYVNFDTERRCTIEMQIEDMVKLSLPVHYDEERDDMVYDKPDINQSNIKSVSNPYFVLGKDKAEDAKAKAAILDQARKEFETIKETTQSPVDLSGLTLEIEDITELNLNKYSVEGPEEDRYLEPDFDDYE